MKRKVELIYVLHINLKHSEDCIDLIQSLTDILWNNTFQTNFQLVCHGNIRTDFWYAVKYIWCRSLNTKTLPDAFYFSSWILYHLISLRNRWWYTKTQQIFSIIYFLCAKYTIFKLTYNKSFFVVKSLGQKYRSSQRRIMSLAKKYYSLKCAIEECTVYSSFDEQNMVRNKNIMSIINIV